MEEPAEEAPTEEPKEGRVEAPVEEVPVEEAATEEPQGVLVRHHTRLCSWARRPMHSLTTWSSLPSRPVRLTSR